MGCGGCGGCGGSGGCLRGVGWGVVGVCFLGVVVSDQMG